MEEIKSVESAKNTRLDEVTDSELVRSQMRKHQHIGQHAGPVRQV